MKTTKDFFNKIRYVEQLFNTIKLAEDRVSNSSKLLCMKRGRSIGFVELGLGNRI